MYSGITGDFYAAGAWYLGSGTMKLINGSPTNPLLYTPPAGFKAGIYKDGTTPSATPPTANAGSNQTITLPTTTATFAGSGTAGSSSIVGILWTQLTGTSATITTPTSYTSGITGLSTAGVRTFELAVTDANGLIGRDTMSITVNNETTPPTLSSTNPTTGATGVAITVHPTATFSEALASGTVNTTNITMTRSGTPVTITVGLVSNVITITPSASLLNSTVYVINLGTGITDVAGNAYAGGSFTFTTAAAVPTGTFTVCCPPLR